MEPKVPEDIYKSHLEPNSVFNFVSVTIKNCPKQEILIHTTMYIQIDLIRAKMPGDFATN